MNKIFTALLLLSISTNNLVLGQKSYDKKYEKILDTVIVQDTFLTKKKVPKNYKFDEELGFVLHKSINGQVIYKNYKDLFLDDTRAIITPKGDYLVMFPNGGHYGGKGKEGIKVNDMFAFRSKDKGKTWEGPTTPFDIDYNQHAFIPLIPKGSNRIYAFGTQPIWSTYDRGNGLFENAPIGFRYSDDDGYTWSKVELIKPKNDPDFRGMSAMRMCETDNGTWLLGTHEGDWSYKPLITRQYLLRSEDRGKTWEILPGKRHRGWFANCFGRMDEGRPINLGNGEVYFMCRTPEGHLWASRSTDDGKSWSEFEPTPLTHPDAPPMLFKLSDGKTLIAFHHNNSRIKTGDLTNDRQHLDRSELWFALSKDGGRTWSEPRFLMVNAFKPALGNSWKDYNASYGDMFADNGKLHFFLPHRWTRVVHFTIKESDLDNFYTKEELLKNID